MPGKVKPITVNQQNSAVSGRKAMPLASCFLQNSRNQAIMIAAHAGYRRAEIAAYLSLTHATISRIIQIEKEKTALFEKLKNKGLFWSYDKLVTLNDVGDKIFIEHLFKYADFDDIVEAFKLYGSRKLYKEWVSELKNDLRFKKLNLFLARVFFGMDVEADYFQGGASDREKKLRLLAS